MIALLAIAIVVLAILAVCLHCIVRQEQDAQSGKTKADPKFTYRFTGYDYRQAVKAKALADKRHELKRKTEARRAEVVALESRRRA